MSMLNAFIDTHQRLESISPSHFIENDAILQNTKCALKKIAIFYPLYARLFLRYVVAGGARNDANRKDGRSPETPSFMANHCWRGSHRPEMVLFNSTTSARVMKRATY